jgi:hypothetical protein
MHAIVYVLGDISVALIALVFGIRNVILILFQQAMLEILQ